MYQLPVINPVVSVLFLLIKRAPGDAVGALLESLLCQLDGDIGCSFRREMDAGSSRLSDVIVVNDDSACPTADADSCKRRFIGQCIDATRGITRTALGKTPKKEICSARYIRVEVLSNGAAAGGCVGGNLERTTRL